MSFAKGVRMADEQPGLPVVAIDTNTLVQSIPRRGPFRPIIEAFDEGRFILVVSNDILLEYEEILKRLGGPASWSAFVELLGLREANVRRIDPSYFWRAITHDPDDDKFVDAAVAMDADWIVTEDHHFDVLFENPALRVRPIEPVEFMTMHL